MWTSQRTNSVFIFIFCWNDKEMSCAALCRGRSFAFVKLRIKFWWYGVNSLQVLQLVLISFPPYKILSIFCLQNYWSNRRRWQPSCTLYMSSAFQMKPHPPGIIVRIVFIQWQQLIFISFISLSKLQSYSCFILRKLLVPRSRCLESSYFHQFVFIWKCCLYLLIWFYSVIFRNSVICRFPTFPSKVLFWMCARQYAFMNKCFIQYFFLGEKNEMLLINIGT